MGADGGADVEMEEEGEDGRGAVAKKLSSYTAPKAIMDEIARADVRDDTLPEVRSARARARAPVQAGGTGCRLGYGRGPRVRVGSVGRAKARF